MRRIVLTGGPNAGKTVIAGTLARDEPGRFVVVPEAATQVYTALRTRWDRLDADGRRDVQRRIYRLQREQEQRLAEACPGRVLLLDRGTIDGSAYWPDGPAAYWADLRTDATAELARYDAVIWLETSAAIGHYEGDAGNPVRFEAPDAAIENGRRLKELWAGHPRLHHVGAFADFADKLAAVREVIDDVLGLLGDRNHA